MKMLIQIFLLFTLSMAANSAVRRFSQDAKLPTQQMIEKQDIDDAILADVDYVLNDTNPTSTTATTTVSSFLNQPDVCRALSITPGGTTADVPAGDITINGTNYWNDSISEAFTLAANQTTIAHGTKAFCSVTSIVFPAQDGADATYDVGVNDVLGLKRCMDNTGALIYTAFDGVYESTRATITSHATTIELNTIDINGTLDGAKDINAYFMQNFRCVGPR